MKEARYEKKLFFFGMLFWPVEIEVCVIIISGMKVW